MLGFLSLRNQDFSIGKNWVGFNGLEVQRVPRWGKRNMEGSSKRLLPGLLQTPHTGVSVVKSMNHKPIVALRTGYEFSLGRLKQDTIPWSLSSTCNSGLTLSAHSTSFFCKDYRENIQSEL